MQTFIQRSVWGTIWLVTMAIAILLSYDMAKDQPILFSILMLCLFTLSVSLVYARSLWGEKNRTSATACLWVGILCLCVVVVSEISYWSGSIEGVNDQIARDQAKAKGVDLVKERRREQLARAAAGKLPAEIEADIATAMGTREVIALKAQLKAARELKELEGQVLADSTQVVSTTIKRSFYEAARIGSEQIGGEVRTWIVGIVFLVVCTMMSLHLLALYIGCAPRRPSRAEIRERWADLEQVEASRRLQDARTATEAPGAIQVAPQPAPAFLVASPGLQTFTSPGDDRMWAVTTEEEPRDPPPSGGKPTEERTRKVAECSPSDGPVIPPLEEVGQPDKTAATAEDEDNESPVFDYNTKLRLTPKEQRRLARELTLKKKEIRRNTDEIIVGDVDVWANLLLRKGKPNQVVTSKECRDNFDEYCRIHGYETISKKVLSRQIGAAIDRLVGTPHPKGKRRARNAAGAVWWGVTLLEPSCLLNLSPERARA